MSAVTEDFAQALIDAAKADMKFSMLFAESNLDKGDLIEAMEQFVLSPVGQVAHLAKKTAKERAVLLLDLMMIKDDNPVKKEKAKKLKKEKEITSLYVLIFNHEADGHGRPRATKFYFRSKPTQQEAKDCLLENGCDPLDKDVWEIMRLTCGKAYGFRGK